jgi:hypothetical protein
MCVIPIPEAADGLAPGYRYTYDVMGSGEAVRFQIPGSVATDNDGVLMIEIQGFE